MLSAKHNSEGESHGDRCYIQRTGGHPVKNSTPLGIKDGTYIQIDVDDVNKRIILTPVTREYVHSQRGKYKGKGLMKALMTDKKREKEY